MALNRKVSEDEWFDVGDASAIKSARRAADASPPPQNSSARLGSPPPQPLPQKDISEAAEILKDTQEDEAGSMVSPSTTSARTSMLVLEEDEEEIPSVKMPSPKSPCEASVEDTDTKVSPLPESIIISPTSDVPLTDEMPETENENTLVVTDMVSNPEKGEVATPNSAPPPANESVSTISATTQKLETEPPIIVVSVPHPAAATNAINILKDLFDYVPPRIVAIALGIYVGFKDSSNMLKFIKYCDKDHSILRTFIHCTVLNTIFIISLFTIVDLVAPLQPTGAFAVVWETLFSLLWVVPMYAITQVLGITWYEEIYRKCVQVRASERNRSTQPTRDVSFIGVSELVMKFLVTLVFGLLAAVIAMVVPRNFLAICGVNIPVGALISFVMSCWLHAFYCFDYRFLDQGRVDRNGQSADSAPKLIPAKLSFLITIFERKWPYYLGYGASHIIIRTFMEWIELPLFARMAVCSALFTVNVVTTVEASVRWEGDATVGRLPIFTPFYKKLSEWVAAANANRARTASERKSTVKGPVDKDKHQE